MAVEFDWVDAFSARPFAGNGCSVVYDDGKWSNEVCLAYVRETSLVECTFIAPSENADYRVRYFLASREIPFAGHPTIATAKSLYDRGLIGREAVLETGAGLVPISIDDAGWIKMRQQAPEFAAEFDKGEIARIYGLTCEDIIDAPQFVSTGLPFIVTLLKDRNALERAKLDADSLADFQGSCGFEGFVEPYLATLDGFGGDSLARLLLPPPNPAEDPFTGSATGCLASYLWARGHITKDEFTHEQGHMLERLGQAKVELIGTLANIEGVYVSGQAFILMRGGVEV